MVLKKQNGASAVEFAILLPFLVSLAFGIIEIGLLLYNQQVLTNASREGARAAIKGDCNYRLANTTNPQIDQIVTDYCNNRLITFAAPTPEDLDVDINPSPSDCTPATPGTPPTPGSGLGVGEDVEVAVSYTYTFLVPSLFGFGGPEKQLNAKTVMKMMSNP